MSALYKGNLLNSGLDIFIDSVLLLLIPVAYLAQLVNGYRNVSSYYLLLSALTANAQLSEAVLMAAYAWPTDANAVLSSISGGDLSGVLAYGGILGLLQILSQWSCVLLQAVVLRGHGFIAVFHAVAVVYPALASAYPPAPHSMGPDIVLAIIDMSNLVVAPCCIVLQLYAQRTSQGLKLPLSLQALAFALLAIRWRLRLGEWTGRTDLPADLPFSERLTFWRYHVQYMYTWGYPSINFAMQSIVCIVLLCYQSQAVSIEETQPLLT